MRRAAIVLVAVMMCAGYSSGQSNGLPQWKVVKVGQRANSCVEVGPMVILTPKKAELYRFGGYVSLTSSEHNGSWIVEVHFTDTTGQAEIIQLGIGGNPYNGMAPMPFSPLQGTDVTLHMYGQDLPRDASCYTGFTIEKLTH